MKEVVRMDAKFSRNQRRIWLACFFSYAAAYVARLNMGAALGSVIEDLNLTDAQGALTDVTKEIDDKQVPFEYLISELRY